MFFPIVNSEVIIHPTKAFYLGTTIKELCLDGKIIGQIKISGSEKSLILNEFVLVEDVASILELVSV